MSLTKEEAQKLAFVKETDLGGNVIKTISIGKFQVGTVADPRAIVAHGGLSGSLTQLVDGRSYLVAGSGVSVSTGSSGQVTVSTTGGSGGADAKASYVVMAVTASLSRERALSVGTGLSSSDGGSGGNVTLSVRDSIVATVSGATFTGNVGIGSPVASTGSLRFQNSGSITFRNAANNADVRVLQVRTNNVIVFGGPGESLGISGSMFAVTSPTLFLSKSIGGGDGVIMTLENQVSSTAFDAPQFAPSIVFRGHAWRPDASRSEVVEAKMQFAPTGSANEPLSVWTLSSRASGTGDWTRGLEIILPPPGILRTELRFGPSNTLRINPKGSTVEMMSNDVMSVIYGESAGASQLGFHGAAALARQVIAGSRGGNAALESLLTALNGIGLVTDNTTV